MSESVIWKPDAVVNSKLLSDSSAIVILTDEHTATACLPHFVDHWLGEAPFHHLSIEPGESNKSLETVATIYSSLLDLELDRKGLIIALGGGVVTDIGGFVASTYKRGVALLNVPTTHLAMVDAAIGGKNGVNLGHLKNQVGSFHPAKAVIVDPRFLESLDMRQRMSGWMETVKHAVIGDAQLWDTIEAGDATLLVSDPEIIQRSIAIKQGITVQDEQDLGTRQALNFGHTIGHALEVESDLLHGEAVAFGTISELWLSNQKTALSVDKMDMVISYITSLGFPIEGMHIDQESILQKMKHDKKNESGEIRFALISDIGRAEVGIGVSPDLIKASLDFAQHVLDS